jgi:hypothetical protein
VAIRAARDQLAPADLVLAQRLGAVLDQRIGAHIVIGADHQVAQRVHQREIAVAAIAGPEQVAHQHVQLAVFQPAADVAEELLLFGGPHIPHLVLGAGGFQRVVVFLMVGD